MVATNPLISDYLTQKTLFSPTKRETQPINESYTGFSSVTDTLNLSAASITAYSDNWILNQLRGVTEETIDGKYKTLGQVKSDLFSDLNSFNDLAGALFGSAGITTPITLQMTGAGSLKQVGTENEKVSGVIKDNQVLTPRFALIAARAAIGEAANREADFTKDYHNNPPATMQKYEATLKNLMLNFQLTLSNGTSQMSFAE